MIRRKLTLGGVAAIAAAVAVAGCGSSGVTAGGSTSGPIKLGISVPLTGAVGSSCGPLNKATVAWFDHINKQGGIDGRRITTDTKDDAYAAARAVTNTKGFISEGVTAVVGQCGSIQPPAQVPLLAPRRIPFLFPFGAVESLFHPVQANTFALLPLYGSQLVSAVNWTFQHRGAGTAVMINTATPDVDATINETRDAVNRAGGRFLATYTVPAGTGDFSPYVLRMRALHPDYVILDQTPQDAARVVNVMTTAQFSPNRNLIGSSAISLSTFLSAIDKGLATRLIATSATLAPVDAQSTQCGRVIRAAGLEVNGPTLWGCGSAQVITSALLQAGRTVTAASLTSTLDSWTNRNASDIFPPVTFSATNHLGVKQVFVFGVRDDAFYTIDKVPVSG